MIVGTRSPVAGFPDPELGPGVVPHYCRAAAETEANIGRVIGIRHVFHRRKPGPPSREGEIGLRDAYYVAGTASLYIIFRLLCLEWIDLVCVLNYLTALSLLGIWLPKCQYRPLSCHLFLD